MRVVPPHHPSLAVSTEAAQARLTYRGGPLLANVEVFTIFWGGTWGKTSSSTALMSRLNAFFADVLVSPLIDQLAEYDVPGQAIGHGSFLGSKEIRTAALMASVTDTAVHSELQG